MYSLSPVDLCELARNSVIHSGWDIETKKLFIGNDFDKYDDSRGNDINKTNVPDCRLDYRYSVLTEEKYFIECDGYELMESHEINRRKSSKLHQLQTLSEFVQIDNDDDKTDIEPLDDASLNVKAKKQRRLSDIALGTLKSKFNDDNEQKITQIANELVKNSATQDGTKPPLHEEWIKLAKEKQKLELKREELNLLLQSLHNNNNDNGISRSLTESFNKKNAQQQISGIIKDIFGDYYDEKDNINTINNNNTMILNNSTTKLKVKSKNKTETLIKIKVELKKTHLSDMKIVDTFTQKMIKKGEISGKLDCKVGELIWEHGLVWYKNDLICLQGYWIDQDKYYIEIKLNGDLIYLRQNKSLHNISINGFKKIKITTKDGTPIYGKIEDPNTIKLDSGDIFHRPYDQDKCIVM